MRFAIALLFASCAPSSPAPPESGTVTLVPPKAEPLEEPDASSDLGTIHSIGVTAGGSSEVRIHQPSEPKRAEENRQRCASGNLAGCHAAALDAYYSPRGPDTDRDAAEFFKKACDGGYAPSCNGLGVLYQDGRGVKKDETEAARWYYRSCLDGASTGCDHLASALSAGRGLPKDTSAAARATARGRCVFEASLHDAGLAQCPSLLGDGGR